MTPTNNTTNGREGEQKPAAPTISLPKGGGAVRGIGEKFAANPVTGTGSMSVPIATSPGRSGFGLQLSVSYDSGSGNGLFGFGWSLSLPSITRKTDKGLPQYNDADESDVFILSGAEDLVPVLKPDGTRHDDDKTAAGYIIRRYRPRIEGLFARIERWTRQSDGDVHWRSISKDNILTLYGSDVDSRIAGPEPEHASRIFSWLICETRDDKGNAVLYGYKREDGSGIDLTRANERNRGTPDDVRRKANRYLKRIRYGNRLSLLDGAGRRPRFLSQDDIDNAGWMFEVVFDYGEHSADAPKPDDAGQWAYRDDPFSTYRPGFEVRTTRLCRRVLMFHHIPDLATGEKGYEGLVRSTDFAYSPDQVPADDARNPLYTFLLSVTQSGYKRNTGGYLKRSLPPVEFKYTQPLVQDTVEEVDPASLENLPIGVDGAAYQWTDLHGEGIPGILTEQAGGWFYKRNLSPISKNPVEFAPLEHVATKPNLALAGGQAQFMDLAGDGQLDLVVFDDPMPGLYEHDDAEDWQPFRPFTSRLNRDMRDPNLKFVDLDGDGHADVLVSEDDAFVWHASLAAEGFGPARRVVQVLDEEKGPRLVFADGTQSIYLADMSGDGLTDLVRIRNGEVCYWPNLGYGRFGAKVTMDHAPWFDNPDQFDHKRIRVADIDGSGTTDIIYLHRDGVRLYFNQSGNSWSQPHQLKVFPRVDDVVSIVPIDLLGNGTACLVWSSPLPGDARRPMRYVNLMGEQKPHLLVRTINNLGAETRVDYASSTKFYLQDKRAGKPWITKLAFPVHVVEKVTVADQWRKTSFSSTYSYHHGYFDGIQREFRGFGRVEQVDVESYGEFAQGNIASPYIADDKTLYQPPVKTITWYHTGAFLDRERILSQFEHEYFPRWLEEQHPGLSIAFQENPLPQPDLRTEKLTAEEWREALRACKGMMLRQEVVELDIDALERPDNPEQLPVKLFSTAYHNCHIRCLQPMNGNRHAVFLVAESEAITYNYELDITQENISPDPRVAHTLNLEIDEYGNILESVAAVYPRVGSNTETSLSSEHRTLIDHIQKDEHHLALNCTRFTTDIDEADTYRLRMSCQTQSWEVTGIQPLGTYFTLAEVKGKNLSSSGASEISYHIIPDGTSQKRLVECARTLFFADDLKTHRPFGQHGPLGLSYESYKLALTSDLLNKVYVDPARIATALSALDLQVDSYPVSGYYKGDQLFAGYPITPEPLENQYWIASGKAGFESDAADHFYLPEKYTDPFGNLTRLSFDPNYDLFIQSSTDALGNTSRVEQFDYRVLAPREMVDINGNHTEVYFDILGMVVASAVKGKGTEADDLTGFDDALANPSAVAVQTFCTDSVMNLQQANDWLGKATARFVYHFGEGIDASGDTVWIDRMAGACNIVRERHASQVALDPLHENPLQVSLECSDGSGNVLMKKVQAEPEHEGGPLRWVINGLTVLNNKGKPVKQYEPAFTPNFGCELPAANDVTPVMYYDAAGRLVRTEMPDGTFSRVEFSPWHVRGFDQNDTVIESEWYTDRTPTDPDQPLPRNPITGELLVTPDQRAAWLAAQHHNTPSLTILDSLGRNVISIANNGPNTADKHLTFTRLDAEGKPLWIRDARNNLVMQYITPTVPNNQAADPVAGFVPCYDIAGDLLYQHSMDAGDRWMLMDAAGKQMLAWDLNDKGAGTPMQKRIYRTDYDALHRPTRQWLKIDSADPALVEAFDYCDTNDPGGLTLNDAQRFNLLGQAIKHWDPTGLATVERIDLSGKPAQITRTLVKVVTDPALEPQFPDWNVTVRSDLLEMETFIQINEYDVLGRMTRHFNWHRDITYGATGGPAATPGGTDRVTVYVPTYNERGALVSELLHVRATKVTDSEGRVSFTSDPNRSQQAIKVITYNAKGQKLTLELGNGTTTRYTYDDTTFRLTHLYTRRDARFANDCAANPDAARPARPCGVQNLHYTYDPVGNITHIQDDAQQTIYFANSAVEPSSDYTYDALYRLIEATGRENAAAVAPPRNREDPWPTDGFASANALRNYTQRYTYDSVGNFVEMGHLPSLGSGWTRHYTTQPDSNRLDQTWYGGTTINAVTYRHDTHGNMLNLNRVGTPPPLDPDEEWGLDIRWDWRDMIRGFDLGGGGIARYHYGIDKQRTRKHITRIGGAVEDRIYLGGYELYRRYNGNGTTLVEEIETHHLFEGEQRVLMVDDVITTNKTHADGRAYQTGPIYRYQYSNHLGSACLELDDQAEIISYEEYHPYGTGAYRAMKRSIEAPPKRYRYTGMERDEESGLSYHSTRCLVPWLGRWASCDSAATAVGQNRYVANHDSPIVHADTNGKDPPLASFGAPTPKPPVTPKLPSVDLSGGASAGAGNATWTAAEGVSKPVITKDVATGPQIPTKANVSATEGRAAAVSQQKQTNTGPKVVFGLLVLDQILKDLPHLAENQKNYEEYLDRTLPGPEGSRIPKFLPGVPLGPMSFPSANAAYAVVTDPEPRRNVSLPGAGNSDDVAQLGRPSSLRKKEHQDFGYYWDPFTNDIIFVNERMATDHIYPEAKIRELINTFGEGKLTDRQIFEILNFPDNFQPLPTSLNSSKRDRTAEEWQEALGQSFDPDYIRNAIELENKIGMLLIAKINEFKAINEAIAKDEAYWRKLPAKYK